eukprot:UN31996
MTIVLKKKWFSANYVFEIKEVKQDELTILREVCADRQKDINLLVQEVKRLNVKCKRLENECFELKRNTTITTTVKKGHLKWETRLKLNVDDHF